MPIHIEGDDPEAPKCPKCGAKTRLRNSVWGGDFYGCSKFPDCKGIVSIASEYDIPDTQVNSEAEIRSIIREGLPY